MRLNGFTKVLGLVLMTTTLVGFCVFLLVLGFVASTRNTDAFYKQIEEQHCIVVGYTGSQIPRKIYQCDDGLRLDGELK